MCSTPRGIKDQNGGLRRGRIVPRGSAQRLAASKIKTEIMRGAKALMWSSAQRLAASKIKTEISPGMSRPNTTSAQRLAASKIKTDTEFPKLLPYRVCSTPRGIKDQNGFEFRPKAALAAVLNASRHQRSKRTKSIACVFSLRSAQRLAASKIKTVHVIFQRPEPGLVLNASRHQRSKR